MDYGTGVMFLVCKKDLEIVERIEELGTIQVEQVGPDLFWVIL